MKKIILIVISVLFITLIFAQTTTTLDNTSHLPRDGNRNGVQVGRYIQIYDDANTNFEHLDENDFATHVNWDATNDITDTEGLANWTWADAVGSTLTQVAADQLYALKDGETALLTYTVYDSTAIAGGVVAMYVNGICDSTAMSVVAGVEKTLAITGDSDASTSDFVINIIADASVSAGEFSIDDLYLTTYYGSPLLIATGDDLTLTTPTNAVELIIDPMGTDVKIEIGDYHYIINSKHPIPCESTETIKIGNDSGAAATVYFYYNML